MDEVDSFCVVEMVGKYAVEAEALEVDGDGFSAGVVVHRSIDLGAVSGVRCVRDAVGIVGWRWWQAFAVGTFGLVAQFILAGFFLLAAFSAGFVAGFDGFAFFGGHELDSVGKRRNGPGQWCDSW